MKPPTTRPARPSPQGKDTQRPRTRPAVNLKRLRSPASDHDLKTALKGFESRIKARAENRERVKCLRKWADATPAKGEIKKAKLPVADAKRLTTKLRKQALGQLAPTFAS